ncbi:hypothetical protein MCHIJ_51070 [Mycolicibacterium chitae]|uniref:Lipocalin-like domain-containing protein n=1 Tax=Mycolicibacterium chitae TaxID=1792 RepID=A0A3S5EIK4_MYCCI|nr:lipocalin-like domain-containing protein [Mycolicibacterium chitae]MCV7105050.1 lipocalin-like domain-containing protein [Mycolicibacterium chitae]BBZ05670.1 hypothetical protein MCHIJ_51070 [Mycolicibacterium chitae]VEG49281.1 Uncharacterised protein [Mycolicibacterium chitae]
MTSFSLRQRLIGSWQLVSYSTRTADNHIGYPLGTDARGLILYTADGHMSAQIMARDRPAYRSARVHGGTVEERDSAAAGYLAYSGSFRVDEAESVVWHEVAVSLYPNWVGDVQKRYAQLDQDVLTLSSDPLVFRTTTLWPTLVWRRADTEAVSHHYD